MKSQQEIEYLAAFETFSPQKKREHFAFALRFLINVMAEKEKIASAKAQDVDVIDGECTTGGEA